MVGISPGESIPTRFSGWTEPIAHIHEKVHQMIISGYGMRLMQANLMPLVKPEVAFNSKLSPDTMVGIYRKWVSVFQSSLI